MPEQLAFDQLSRQPTRVQGHEGSFASGASLVKRPRDQLLTDARLTADQRWPRHRSDSIHLGHQGDHRGRPCHQDAVGAGLAWRASGDEQLRTTHAHDGPRPKWQALNAVAIDPGTVRASEVADDDSIGRGFDAAVEAADGPVWQSEAIV